MSNAVFPVLPGLKWGTTKQPMWSTKIQKTVSGRELRAAYYVSPLYKFTLAYEVLRLDTLYTELKTLMGFFNQRLGSFDSFLYEDIDDKSVTSEFIGTGNGVLTQFQLIRSFGGFIEAIKNINGAVSVYLNGVLQGSGYSINSTGLITFATPPANGVTITASFNFYYRVRFAQDQAEFTQFMKNLWELRKCELLSVKE